MIIKTANRDVLHLCYCTNIHPGDSWEKIFRNIRNYSIKIKKKISPNRPFGIGLRLSNQESKEILKGDNLEKFREFCSNNGLYVFTMNGFPYGNFHGQKIKSKVFAPDWRSKDRVDYTVRLAKILSCLLPEKMEGGISTVPLSYKPWISGKNDYEKITKNFVKAVKELILIKEQAKKFIHIDIEPEPCGLLENSDEIVDFYNKYLLKSGAKEISRSMNIPIEDARKEILDHAQICFDACHMAVEYGEPESIISQFSKNGIKIGKVQLSAALKISFPNKISKIKAELKGLSDGVYLHQVMARRSKGFHCYNDLGQAVNDIKNKENREYRIHFHVPLFTSNYGGLQSTQDYLYGLLKLLKKRRITNHLEIETYTWDVLPKKLKKYIVNSITREYEWALKGLINGQ